MAPTGTRTGHYKKITDFPYVAGRDFSGLVSRLGDGVKDFRSAIHLIRFHGVLAPHAKLRAAIVPHPARAKPAIPPPIMPSTRTLRARA